MKAVIRNALPQQTAVEVRKLLVESDTWRPAPFVDSSYYGAVYSEDPRPSIPKAPEVYTTSFDKSEYLAECQQTRAASLMVASLVDTMIPNEKVVDKSSISLLAYRLRPGGHLRVHNDKYGADLGFIWYLSREWRWDWGGLLVSVNPDGSAEVEIPEFNKLVIINHSRTVSHCVTTVETWAQDDRYMIVGMMRVRDR